MLIKRTDYNGLRMLKKFLKDYNSKNVRNGVRVPSASTLFDSEESKFIRQVKEENILDFYLIMSLSHFVKLISFFVVSYNEDTVIHVFKKVKDGRGCCYTEYWLQFNNIKNENLSPININEGDKKIALFIDLLKYFNFYYDIKFFPATIILFAPSNYGDTEKDLENLSIIMFLLLILTKISKNEITSIKEIEENIESYIFEFMIKCGIKVEV